jgi:hypothetical protein
MGVYHKVYSANLQRVRLGGAGLLRGAGINKRWASGRCNCHFRANSPHDLLSILAYTGPLSWGFAHVG